MTFTEVVQSVHSIVKRPDRIVDIQREVNAAVNFFSTDINATRDIAEVLTPISAVDYTQAIALTTFPYWRKFAYIKRAGTKEFLTKVSMKKLYSKDCAYADTYYVASNSLKISMVTLASNLDIGYYMYPAILTDAAPNHWLLDAAWPCIYNRALGKILGSIGDSTAAQRHEGFAVAEWLSKRSDLEAEEGQ